VLDKNDVCLALGFELVVDGSAINSRCAFAILEVVAFPRLLAEKAGRTGLAPLSPPGRSSRAAKS
jgi:hypothetical protein